MRYVYAILGVFLVVGVLVFVKFKQISKLISFGKEMQQAGPPPEVVGTAEAKPETWEGTLSAVGTIAPVQGVSISNEAPGVVTKVRFESGALVKQGEVLVELDSTVERSQVAAVIARRDLAQQTLDRNRALVAKGVLAAAQLEAEEAQLKTAIGDLGALNAQIARKTVRAPFAGRLGIRTVNVGQYLNPGTTLTTLVGVEAVFVDFSLPQQQLVAVKAGMPIRVTIEGAEGLATEGTIAALDPTIDPASRNIKLRGTVPNKDEKLHPGMFAKVEVVLPEQKSQTIIPLTALVHASYGDSVFVVEDDKGENGAPPAKNPDGSPAKIARQQFVKLGAARGDFVAIVDGVKAGEIVVTSGAFKLRNKARITIDNTVQAKSELSPRPENH
jgi:membrane fusion protein, multidrug efflux system